MFTLPVVNVLLLFMHLRMMRLGIIHLDKLAVPPKIGPNSSTSPLANKGITYMALGAEPLDGIFFVSAE
ncbi:hypothetical protein NP590_09165 [Methylomonas sp. SURF-2]|uniref:Uncharacterized protein n=1 Tax=Methylomonas subterranea TaxID=2952225 RepID=A0ABT1TG38_9GAMM|nr:hypothetical protein [Methylomonas sp. SURF-2]MCQ8104274.1 hypothetical protein [Methylomonas sp. SURF-2]